MSVKKFKFVSPGIFINEIDNSQLTKTGDDIGPVIIGTALRGPSMVPTRIESFSDFVETFGEPLSGSEGSDVWREGNRLAPTYAAYAAQAYLRNASPVTFVRLLGQAHPDGSDKAGWTIADPDATFTPGTTEAAGAYGLFISNGGSSAVAAKAQLTLSGVDAGDAGFAVAIEGDSSEAGGQSLVEASADHIAVQITLVDETSGGDLNYSSTGGGAQGVQKIVLAGTFGTRTYTLGHESEGGTGSDVPVADGAVAAAIASDLVDHINAEDGDTFQAVLSGSTAIIRQKVRGGAFAGSMNATLTGIGGAAAATLSDDKGEVNPFTLAYSSGAGAYIESDGDVSIAGAYVGLGGSPTDAIVQSGGGGSSALDTALAAQVASVINSGSSEFNAISGFSASAAAGVVTVSSGRLGAAGNTKTFAVTALGGGASVSGNFADGVNSSLTGQTAALAAIIYAKSGAVSLLGSAVSDDAQTLDGINSWVRSDGANSQFKLRARNTAASASDVSNKEDIAFNFNKNSRLYIRNVLNTNPTLCDVNISGAGKLKAYFLGETFDRHLAEIQDGLSTAKGEQFACLMPLAGAGDHTADATGALTPWIISQHNGEPDDFDTSSASLLASGAVENLGIEKLMRFHSLYAGQWERKNLKVSIEDIKAPTDKFNPYGTFSVVIRKAEDSDAAPQVAERFSSCNLNPASVDYVGKKVGDMKMVWDDDERRYVSHGQFENQSRFLRVEVSTSVESGLADPRMLPFGFLGPRKRKDVVFDNNGGNGTVQVGGSDIDFIAKAADSAVKFCDGSAQTAAAGKITIGPVNGGADTTQAADAFTVTLKFPEMSLRTSTADSSLSSPRDANFGISVAEKGGETVFDESYMDLAGYCGYGIQAGGSDPASADGENNQHQFIFTLDDIRYAYTGAEGGPDADANRDSVTQKPKVYVWQAGSRAGSGLARSLTGNIPQVGEINEGIVGGFEAVLDKGVRGFTLPLLGGHDGVDIFQVQPFAYHASNSSNDSLAKADDSALSHYALNSLKKAVDTVADPEVVDMNLLAAPGVTHPSITSHMVSVCEKRGDALAVIDIDNDYMPMGMDIAKSEADRMPSVDKAINALRERSINSSYGCTFFPWVQIADTMSGRVLWAPPSVAALGTMASSSRRSELWFAPAGFTRGGLTDGAAGVPVSSVRLRLNSKERDKLYEANINPIAQFPAEGIVIFGQKTLQVTPSALDRINVRRLMIFLKKSISRMAKTVLFDQNVETTWARFTSQADPFLASVKSRFGLSEYRIILDKTTTTTELIDRNIMYAKILLKPTRAIEYIAIDFVITDSGASFDD